MDSNFEEYDSRYAIAFFIIFASNLSEKVKKDYISVFGELQFCSYLLHRYKFRLSFSGQ